MDRTAGRERKGKTRGKHVSLYGFPLGYLIGRVQGGSILPDTVVQQNAEQGRRMARDGAGSPREEVGGWALGG